MHIYKLSVISEWRIRCNELLHAGRSGDRFPVAVGFSVFLQNSFGAHPAYTTVGTLSFS